MGHDRLTGMGLWGVTGGPSGRPIFLGGPHFADGGLCPDGCVAPHREEGRDNLGDHHGQLAGRAATELLTGRNLPAGSERRTEFTSPTLDLPGLVLPAPFIGHRRIA